METTMRNIQRWALAATLVLAGGVMGRAEGPGAGGAEVYRSAFEKQAGAEWSKKTVTKSPSGKHTFLGPFGYESTVLTLENLPAHGRVRISFDLMILLTWDGDASLDNPVPTAPDVFDVTVERGPRLVQASFTARPSSANRTTQSFPGRFPYDHLPPGTGAVESRSLGYQWGGSIGDGPDDYVYTITRTFAHSGKSLKVAFSGINLEPDGNEMWGLGNVRVEVLPAGPAVKFEEDAFEKLWSDLGSEDPKAFVPAMEGMIDLGDPGVAALRKRLAPPAPVTDVDRVAAQWITKLDDDSYSEREKASAALRDLGTAAEKALRAARETTASVEVRTRIDALLEHLKGGRTENAADRRRRRLVEVLELIGSEEARTALGDIGRLSGTLEAWEAKAALRRLEGKAEIPTKLELPPGLPKAPAATPTPVPSAVSMPRHGLMVD
jgi:hypothetical protein